MAVRTLCEFAAKQGDLDMRFTPSPSSQEGVAGHRTVAASRSGSYRQEVSVRGCHKQLEVRGRADGFDPDRLLLEEVKTFKGDLSRMPDNHRALHWAQAKVYAALLCRQLELQRLTVALVYFDVGRQEEAEPLQIDCSAPELETFFTSLCERFLAWAMAELTHRQARDAALIGLAFPHETFRDGQRDLARAVFQAARHGRCLMAQAPTGIGKTIATLFPMLKACPDQALDKIFFLTAKGSGRGLAIAALETIRAKEPTLPLRVIELVARDKACEHTDKVCHGDSCPLAQGFYERLPSARTQAANCGLLTRERLRDIALAHSVCPYYLGQEMARWSDVIVGDYNHYFDSSAALHALTPANAWRVGVLVDEAHNLIDRARSMYTATLDSSLLDVVRKHAAAELKMSLERLKRRWNTLAKTSPATYRVLDELPSSLTTALRDVTAAIDRQLEENAGRINEDLLRFYFDALRFCRLVDTFGAHSIFDMTRSTNARASRLAPSTLCVRNVLPASFLKPKFEAARSVVLFSATLAPWHFYVDTLGLPLDTVCMEVAAPFTVDQLDVHVVRDVSTRFQDRARSLAPIAAIIAEQFRKRRGNYIAYFSSFDYMEQARDQLALTHADIPTWHQARRMSEADRQGFLERFNEDGCGVAFAVLGGVFSEGIDLPGARLIGAFVATLGLPQVNPVNEEFRRRNQVTFQAGYDYTYLFPGLRKVVQAAGRVIRTTTDRGTLHLIDDRFGKAQVRRLLPAWWRLQDAHEAPANILDAGRG